MSLIYRNLQLIAVFLWSIIFAKELFLWIWLWQLKEYHIGRFKAHFQTENGRKLIRQNLALIKLFVLAGLVFYPKIFPYFVVALFSVEVLFILVRIFQKKFRIPKITKKTFVLLSVGFLFEISFIYSILGAWTAQKFFYLYLVFLDMIAPLFISGIVIGFEPFAISWRKKIIARATEKRKQFKDVVVIGITGSYGKTSTKEFLAKILSEKFNVLKTEKHQNSEVGISFCVLNNLRKEHQVFVCEMGAYEKGGIKLLTDIVQPQIGILTGINQQHLATFGSLENIKKTKFELIESLPTDGLAILNGSNKYCRELFDQIKIRKKITGKDIKAENVVTEKDRLLFEVSLDNEKIQFQVPLLGEHWIDNVLMATLAAKELGMSLREIAKACQKIKPMEGMMRLVKTDKNFNVIDATYSANPDGVIAHLNYLKVWQGKKAIIMPCLIELGDQAAEIHRRIGKEIGRVCDLAIVTTKDYFYYLKEGALESGLKDDQVVLEEKPEAIFEKIKDFQGKEDVIILESRVPLSFQERIGIKK
ncbi:UDP-N-acetylmuramoyl-tripeptide--D-alanyl-D-alanine ligase [bacterium]|nr:UDP-N-acetylmuramoyl-tripeptide--D-alanyl-D-alanine ligase [bacterium]